MAGGGNDNYKTIVTSLLGENSVNMLIWQVAHTVLSRTRKFDGNYIVDKLEKNMNLKLIT